MTTRCQGLKATLLAALTSIGVACGGAPQEARPSTQTLTPPREDIGGVSSALSDTDYPTGLVKLNGGSEWTNAKQVSVELSKPTGGAVAQWRYCLSTKNDECRPNTLVTFPRSGKATVTLALTDADVASGSVTVYATFNDEALTRSRESIKYDAAAPTDSATAPTAGTRTGSAATSRLTVSWTAATEGAGGSGIKSYKVAFKAAGEPAAGCGVAAEVVGTTTTAATSFDHTGTKVPAAGTAANYRICAVDAAGNVSAGAVLRTWVHAEATPTPPSVTGTPTITAPAATNSLTPSVTVSGSVEAPAKILVTDDTAPTPASAGWKPYDGTATTAKPFTAQLKAGADGDRTLKAFFMDADANVTSGQGSATVKLDTTGPDVSGVTLSVVAGTGGASLPTVGGFGTSNGSVRVTATGQADDVAKVCVSEGAACATWVAYSSLAATTLSSGDGLKTLTFWMQDSLGNSSSKTTAPVLADRTIDAVKGIVAKPAAASGKRSVALGWLPVMDAGSGLDTYVVSYRVGTASATDTSLTPTAGCAVTAGETVVNAASASASVADLEATKKAAFRVCAKDKAGNVSTSNVVVVPASDDTTPPTVGTAAASVRASAATTAASLTETAVRAVFVRVANAPADAVIACVNEGSSACADADRVVWSSTAALPYSLSSGDGDKTLKVWFADVYGNWTTTAVTSTVRLDTTAPDVTGVTLSVPDYSKGATSVTPSKLPTDASSKLEVCLNTGATACDAASTGWSAVGATTLTRSYTLTATETIRAWFRDGGKNVSAAVVASRQTVFDNAAPAGGTLSAVDVTDVQVGLKWTGLVEANLKASSLKVAYLAGATAPSNCTTVANNCSRTSGDTSTEHAFTCTSLTAATQYSFRVCASDLADNVGAGVALAKVTTKATVAAPTVSAVSMAAYAKASPAELTYTAQAGGTVAKMSKWCAQVTGDDATSAPSVTGCTWTALAAADAVNNPQGKKVPVAIATEGAKKVWFWVQDDQGNVSVTPTTAATVTFDKTAPQKGTVTPTRADGKVTLAVSGFSDNLTSPANLKYVVAQATGTATPACSVTAAGAAAPIDVTGLTNGTTYKFAVCARDEAGNLSSPFTFSATPGSTTAPTPVTLTAKTPTTRNALAFTFDLAATATGATDNRIAKYCLTTAADCTPATAVTAAAAAWSATNVSFSIPGTTQSSAVTVKLVVVDKFGNTASDTETVTYDKVAPGDANLVLGLLSGTPARATLTMSGYDAADVKMFRVASGTKALPADCRAVTSKANTVTVTEVSVEATDATKTVDLALVEGSTAYLRVCAVDAAGNVSSGKTDTGVVKSTNSAPDATGVTAKLVSATASLVDAPAFVKTKAAVAVSYTGSVSAARVCATDGADASACAAAQWVAIPATRVVPVTLSAQGPRDVKLFFRDASFNVSSAVTAGSVHWDETKPTDGTLSIAKKSATEVDVTPVGFADVGSGLDQFFIAKTESVGPALPTAPASCGTTAQELFDGKFSVTLTASKPFVALRLCAKDKAGNISTGVTAAFKASTNLTAPVGTLALKAGTNAVHLASGTATHAGGASIKATLGVTSGTVTAYCVTVNAEACPASGWTTPATAPTSVEVVVPTLGTADGQKTIRAFFRDADYNVSSAATATITLDTTAPVDGTLTAAAGDKNVDLTVSGATDVGVGLDGYVVAMATGTATAAATVPANCNSPTTSTIPPSGNNLTVSGLDNLKNYAFRVCAKDKFGKLSAGKTATARPKAVTTVPTVTLTLTDPANATTRDGVTYVNSAAPKFTLAATAATGATLAGAGAGSCLSTAATCTTFAAQATWPVTGAGGVRLAAGRQTVTLSVRDDNENVGTASKDLFYDAAAPTLTSLTAERAASKRVTLTVVAADKGSAAAGAKPSGLDAFEVKDGSTTLGCNASGTGPYVLDCGWTVTQPTTNALVTLSVKAKDLAGNLSAEKTATVRPVPSVATPTVDELKLVFADGSDRAATNVADVWFKLSGSASGTEGGTANTLKSFCLAEGAAATCAGWSAILTPGASIGGADALVVPWTLASLAPNNAGQQRIVRAWFKDAWGNVSDAKAVTFVFDTKKPTDGAQSAFAVTPAAGGFDLAWAAANDTTPGTVAGYVAVVVEGSAAAATPADCTKGTPLAGCAVAAGSTHCTGKSLKSTTAYRVRLCARDVAGNLSNGVTGSGTTLSSGPTDAEDASAVTLAMTATTAQIDWTAAQASGGAVGYRVVWAAAPLEAPACPGGPIFGGLELIAGTTVTATGLAGDTLYNFRICAYDSGGSSSPGLLVSATTYPECVQGQWSNGGAACQDWTACTPGYARIDGTGVTDASCATTECPSGEWSDGRMACASWGVTCDPGYGFTQGTSSTPSSCSPGLCSEQGKWSDGTKPCAEYSVTSCSNGYGFIPGTSGADARCDLCPHHYWSSGGTSQCEYIGCYYNSGEEHNNGSECGWGYQCDYGNCVSYCSIQDYDSYSGNYFYRNQGNVCDSQQGRVCLDDGSCACPSGQYLDSGTGRCESYLALGAACDPNQAFRCVTHMCGKRRDAQGDVIDAGNRCIRGIGAEFATESASDPSGLYGPGSSQSFSFCVYPTYFTVHDNGYDGYNTYYTASYRCGVAPDGAKCSSVTECDGGRKCGRRKTVAGADIDVVDRCIIASGTASNWTNSYPENNCNNVDDESPPVVRGYCEYPLQLKADVIPLTFDCDANTVYYNQTVWYCAAPNGVECDDDRKCHSGYCGPDTGSGRKCQHECSRDGWVSGGLRCVVEPSKYCSASTTCSPTLSTGSACTANGQCSSGSCGQSKGGASSVCLLSNDEACDNGNESNCPAGSYCKSLNGEDNLYGYYCRAQKIAGEYCNYNNAECLSGLCHSGYCGSRLEDCSQETDIVYYGYCYSCSYNYTGYACKGGGVCDYFYTCTSWDEFGECTSSENQLRCGQP